MPADKFAIEPFLAIIRPANLGFTQLRAEQQPDDVATGTAKRGRKLLVRDLASKLVRQLPPALQVWLEAVNQHAIHVENHAVLGHAAPVSAEELPQRYLRRLEQRDSVLA